MPTELNPNLEFPEAQKAIEEVIKIIEEYKEGTTFNIEAITFIINHLGGWHKEMMAEYLKYQKLMEGYYANLEKEEKEKENRG